jgi:hypothetical protein
MRAAVTKGTLGMRNAFILGVSVLFVLHLEPAYGLDVTLGAGGDHTTIVAAMDAVIADGGGKITIIDNGEYTGHNGIRTPVNITVEGDPLDPPTLKGVDDCQNGHQCKDGGGTIVPCDDPGVVTEDRNFGCPGPEGDEETALFHVKEGADGGTLTLNGLMLDTCRSPTLLCNVVEIGVAQLWQQRQSPVKNYTVNFNDCIFADRDATAQWPNGNGTEIAVWEECDDVTLNFDNCIIPWNVPGEAFCSTAFVSLQHGINPIVNFNQCSIANRRVVDLYNAFVSVQKLGAVVTVTNSIVWLGPAVEHPAASPRLFASPHAGRGNWPRCIEYPEAVTATVTDGGTGYTVGDQLALVGGLLRPEVLLGAPPFPNPQPAAFEVTAESGGVVTAVSVVGTPGELPTLMPAGDTVGAYEEPPTNPAATTGGSGTGATLDVIYTTDPSLEVALLSGNISNAIITDGLIDVSHPLGSITPGAAVQNVDPLFVDVEAGPSALQMMDGFKLDPASTARGAGDAGQDIGWRFGRMDLPGPETNEQIPGDCNQDAVLDLSDIICLLGHLFQGNPETLPCGTEAGNLDLMDINGDDGTDLSDAIFGLAFLFQGDAPPVNGVACFEMECPPVNGCP